MKISNSESPLNNTLFLLIKKIPALGPLTQYQRQRTQYDRFTRAGLARHDVEALVKANLQVINQCVVTYTKFLKHTGIYVV